MIEYRSTDWGIAYAYDNVIEVNKALLKYPRLLREIVKHERQHIANPSFWDTIKIDTKMMFGFENFNLDMLKFLLKHPWISFQSIMPIWYQNDRLEYNTYLLCYYTLIIVLGLLILSKGR